MGAYLSKILDDALEKPQEEFFDPGMYVFQSNLLIVNLSFSSD